MYLYCSACDKQYKRRTWLLRHLVKAHEGYAWVEDVYGRLA